MIDREFTNQIMILVQVYFSTETQINFCCKCCTIWGMQNKLANKVDIVARLTFVSYLTFVVAQGNVLNCNDRIVVFAN